MKRNKIEEKIMEKIRQNEIKTKPKWLFSAEDAAAKLIRLTLMLTAGLSISAIIYYLEVYSIFELAEFGDIGWEILVSEFPYLWLVTAIVCLLMVVWISLKTGENYKYQKRILLIIILSLLVLSAMIMRKGLSIIGVQLLTL